MFISLRTALLAPLLVTSVSSIEAPMPGYGVEDMSWEIEVFPGQPTMAFNGTIEDALSEAKLVNPDWDQMYLQQSADEKGASETKRGAYFNNVICDGGPFGWKYALKLSIEGGIKHLRGVKGRPGSRPGPAMCGRLTCGGGGSIWWCNDNNHDFSLDSFSDIADGAQAILDKCRTNWPMYDHVLGQAFSPQNWNVVVRDDRC